MKRRSHLPASPRWLFVMTLAGYPIAGLLASLLDWDSALTSFPFRAGVVLLALWVLARVAPDRGASNLSLRWLFGFWLIYLVRLVWDGLVAGVPGSQEAIAFFMLAVVIPCSVLAFRGRSLPEVKTALLVVWIGAGICAAAVLMYLLEIGTERSTTELTRRLSFEAINAISLGHVGATTLIAILCLTQHRLRSVTWLAMIPAALAAGTCLILAASRGPMVALGVAAVAFAGATGRWRWLLVMALLLLPQLLSEDSEIWRRFSTIEDDDSSLERLLLQGNAIAQFLDRPILGSAFVELRMLTYPHNLFIETAMALGVVGLVVLCVVLYKGIATAIPRTRRGAGLVPLLFVQYFVGVQFSGAIWGNAGLWATTALLIGLSAGAMSKKRRATSPALAKRTPPEASVPT